MRINFIMKKVFRIVSPLLFVLFVVINSNCYGQFKKSTEYINASFIAGNDSGNGFIGRSTNSSLFKYNGFGTNLNAFKIDSIHIGRFINGPFIISLNMFDFSDGYYFDSLNQVFIGTTFSELGIIKTTDGGKNHHLVAFDPYKKTDIDISHLRSYRIKFSDNNSSIGLVSGVNGVLRTVDKGLNWEKVYSTDISAFYSNIIWGNDGEVLLTSATDFLGHYTNSCLYSSDYGKTFQKRNFNTPVAFENVQFITTKIGFGVTVPYNHQNKVATDIYKTIDGGLSWNKVNEDTQPLRTVRFYDENFGLVFYSTSRHNNNVNWEDRVGVTYNGGKTYLPINFPLGAIEYPKVKWKDSLNIMIGEDYLYYTTNGVGSAKPVSKILTLDTLGLKENVEFKLSSDKDYDKYKWKANGEILGESKEFIYKAEYGKSQKIVLVVELNGGIDSSSIEIQVDSKIEVTYLNKSYDLLFKNSTSSLIGKGLEGAIAVTLAGEPVKSFKKSSGTPISLTIELENAKSGDLVVYGRFNSDTIKNLVVMPNYNLDIEVLSNNIICKEGNPKIVIKNSQPEYYYYIGAASGTYKGEQVYNPRIVYKGNGGDITHEFGKIDQDNEYQISINYREPIYEEDNGILLRKFYRQFIIEKPLADFSINKPNALVGEDIAITANYKNAENFKWIFGNGMEGMNHKDSVIKNLRFNSLGEKQLQLVAWTNNFCYDTTKTRSVIVINSYNNADSCYSLISRETFYNNRFDERNYNIFFSPKIFKNDDYLLGVTGMNVKIPSTKSSKVEFTREATSLIYYTKGGVPKWQLPIFEGNDYLQESTLLSYEIDDDENIIVIGESYGNKTYIIQINGEKLNLYPFPDSYWKDNGNPAFKFLLKINKKGEILWRSFIQESLMHLGTKTLTVKGNNIYIPNSLYINYIKDDKIQIDKNFDGSNGYSNYSYNSILEINSNGDFSKAFILLNSMDLTVDNDLNVIITDRERWGSNEVKYPSVIDKNGNIFKEFSRPKLPESYISNITKYDSSGKYLWHSYLYNAIEASQHEVRNGGQIFNTDEKDNIYYWFEDYGFTLPGKVIQLNIYHSNFGTTSNLNLAYTNILKFNKEGQYKFKISSNLHNYQLGFENDNLYWANASVTDKRFLPHVIYDNNNASFTQNQQFQNFQFLVQFDSLGNFKSFKDYSDKQTKPQSFVIESYNYRNKKHYIKTKTYTTNNSLFTNELFGQNIPVGGYSGTQSVFGAELCLAAQNSDFVIDAGNDIIACVGSTINLKYEAPKDVSYQWITDEGILLGENNNINFAPKKSMTVKLMAYHKNGLVKYDSLKFISSTPFSASVINDTAVCYNSKIVLGKNVSNSQLSYKWTSKNGFNSILANPEITATKSDVYYIEISSTDNCKAYDSVEIKVKEAQQYGYIAFYRDSKSSNYELNCEGRTDVYLINGNNLGANPKYHWYVNNNLVSTKDSLLTSIIKNKDVVKLMVTNTDACNVEDTITFSQTIEDKRAMNDVKVTLNDLNSICLTKNNINGTININYTLSHNHSFYGSFYKNDTLISDNHYFTRHIDYDITKLKLNDSFYVKLVYNGPNYYCFVSDTIVSNIIKVNKIQNYLDFPEMKINIIDTLEKKVVLSSNNLSNLSNQKLRWEQAPMNTMLWNSFSSYNGNRVDYEWLNDSSFLRLRFYDVDCNYEELSNTLSFINIKKIDTLNPVSNNKVNVTPNPANNFILIKWSSDVKYDKLIIYNSNGLVAKEIGLSILASEMNLNITDLKKGLHYGLLINSSSGENSRFNFLKL